MMMSDDDMMAKFLKGSKRERFFLGKKKMN